MQTILSGGVALLAEQQGDGGGGLMMMLPMIVMIGFLFYFLVLLPQRREQRKRQDMLGAIKKNDRVVTIGGIYGVVTNVQRDADEVTLKVDESNNTKLRVTLGAIARIVGDEPSQEAPSK